MARLGEPKGETFRRTYAYEEEPPPVLGQTVILGIEDFPGDAVSCESEADKLVSQKMHILGESHAVDILDEESQWFDLTKSAVELLVEEVDLVRI